MAEDSPKPPTIRWGEPGYYEDWLVGNRSGFLALRDALDDVLSEGEDSPLPDKCESDFRGLTMGKNEPIGSDYESSYLSMIGCSVAITGLLGLLALGIWKLIELLAS